MQIVWDQLGMANYQANHLKSTPRLIKEPFTCSGNPPSSLFREYFGLVAKLGRSLCLQFSSTAIVLT